MHFNIALILGLLSSAVIAAAEPNALPPSESGQTPETQTETEYPLDQGTEIGQEGIEAGNSEDMGLDPQGDINSTGEEEWDTSIPATGQEGEFETDIDTETGGEIGDLDTGITSETGGEAGEMETGTKPTRVSTRPPVGIEVMKAAMAHTGSDNLPEIPTPAIQRMTLLDRSRANSGNGKKGGAHNAARPGPKQDKRNLRKVSELVGLSVKAATARAKSMGFMFRATKIDGKPQPLTKDLRENRVNVEVRKGKVVKVVRFG